MSLWSLVIAEDSVNYVKNPSFEKSFDGWSNFSSGGGAGSESRSDEWQSSGIYSMKMVKTVSTGQWGKVYNVPDFNDFNSGDYVTIRFNYNLVSGAFRSQVNTIGHSTAFHVKDDLVGEGVYELTVGPLSADLTALAVAFHILDGNIGELYVDSIQVEKSDSPSTYFDGDTDGCVWQGIKHFSKSTFRAEEAIGGKIYSLQDLEVSVINHISTGMPNIELITQDQSILPGDLLRDFSVDSRSIVLNISMSGQSLEDIHLLRKTLIDLIKPDKFGKYKPFYIRYIGANSSVPVYLPVVYESGLESNPFNGFNEEISLRLYSPNPMWTSLGNRAYPLSTIQSLTSVNGIIGKEDGEWKELNTGLIGLSGVGGDVVKKGPDGRIYVGGQFTSADSVANTRSFAVWDPELQAFTSLASGSASGGAVNDIVFSPNGDIYVMGTFPSFAGVSNTNLIAKWDDSADSWVSITPSLSASGAEIVSGVLDQLGNLFVTGTFTSINGVSVSNIAKMDTSGTWSALGTGLDAPGFTLEINSSNEIFVGGVFTTANGVTVNNVAKWNGTTFEVLSDGTIGVSGSGVNSLLAHSNGKLYIGGVLTGAGSISVDGICSWNGQQFEEVGSGFASATIFSIKEGNNGTVVVCGIFTTSGDGLQEFPNPIAIWNGSVWVHGEITLLSSSSLKDFLEIDQYSQYIVFPTSQDIDTSDKTIIDYEGTVEEYPVFKFTREGGTSARIVWIENLTNDTRLWMDYDLQDGETLVVDLTPGNRDIYSSFFGTVWRAISQASNLSSFVIQSGINELKIYVEEEGSPTITAHMIISDKFWSIDGVAQ